jgi:branched-chain amino acid transport system permease protein
MLKGVTERSLLGVIATIAVAAIAAALPWFGVSSYVRTLVYYTAYFLALGQAWNLMSGLTGYVSFAHGALAGIGAYAVVIAMNAELPLWLALISAIIASVLASLIIGVTSLRLRGIAFTFATLFFQELVLLVVRKLSFAGGPGGIVLQEILPIWLPHVLMMVAAAGATIILLLIKRTRMGVRVLAIKDDETAATAIGINATRLKLVLFAVSAGIAGFTGAVHGLFASSLFPNVVFAVDISIIALAVPLIGGAGTAMGPVAGALLYVLIREALQVIAPGLHLTIVGLLLLAVILFMRDGIVPVLSRLMARGKATARPVAASGPGA